MRHLVLTFVIVLALGGVAFAGAVAVTAPAATTEQAAEAAPAAATTPAAAITPAAKTAPAAPSANPLGHFSRKEPVHITSDRLVADDISREVKFLGHVVARQGDMVIYANEMDLFYLKGSRDIDRIEATGDVRIVQGTRVATSQKGIYYRNEGRIVLTGSPSLHQGQDVVSGDRITFFLNDQRSIVESSKGGARVNATFLPEQEAKP
jgi:lipopolysaccharide export system protein LptA